MLVVTHFPTADCVDLLRCRVEHVSQLRASLQQNLYLTSCSSAKDFIDDKLQVMIISSCDQALCQPLHMSLSDEKHVSPKLYFFSGALS